MTGVQTCALPIYILEAISEYNNQRSVSDEVLDIPVDLSILNDETIREVIAQQAEFGSKQGLTIDPNQGEGDELDIDETVEEVENSEGNQEKPESKDYIEEKSDKEIEKLESQIKTYYQRILFFSFLTKDKVASLDDILSVIDTNENIRLSKNLLLNKGIIEKISKVMDPFKRSRLDYKIQNISMLACDESVAPLTRAMTSIKKFNRMSESEVITPSKVCDEMVGLLLEEGLKEIVSNQDKLLDIASKSGEYAVSLYKRLTSELGYSHEDVRDIIYSIPTSSVAYEFTRRFYEILDINVENIAAGFNAYDLIDVKNDKDEVDYERISGILKQEKPFRNITLEDEIKAGEKTVRFGAIIGNPPYQISDGGAQASAKPIYQFFVLLGKRLSNRYSCYITPTRWFAGGKGLDEFRDMMLRDETIKELHDFLTPEDVFPNTNNRGGVCYFISDTSKIGENVKFVTHKNNRKISEIDRPLLIDGVDIFLRDNSGIDIINKFNNYGCNSYLEEIISARKPFGLDGNFISSEKFKNDKAGIVNPLKCYGKSQKIGFIDNDIIKKNKNWIKSWKVFTPYANNIGTELNDDNQNSFVGEPGSVCTETFLAIGADLNLSEEAAKNLSVYLKTKFARYLHSLAKISQHGTKQTYRFVPMQDFTEKSDIDWSTPIDNIDEQLFDKYNLSKEEREHIKKSIKDMEKI